MNVLALVIITVAVLLVVAVGLTLWLRKTVWRDVVYPDSYSFSLVSARNAHAKKPHAVSSDLDEKGLLAQLHALAYKNGGQTDPASNACHIHTQVYKACEAVLAKLSPESQQIPRRPLLLPKLMSATCCADVSSQDIAAIINQDPALASTLLKLANSPLYRSRREPVNNVSRVVTMLGNEGVRKLIMIALLQPVAGKTNNDWDRLSQILWEHALSSSFATVEQTQNAKAFDAHMLSLLYGLGAIVVTQVAREAYAEHPGISPDLAVVDALLARWSGVVMRRLIQAWGLDSTLLADVDGESVGTSWHDASPLGRALRTGRLIGAAALLHRKGEIDQEAALRLVEQCGFGQHRASDLWSRLTLPVD